MSSYGFLIFSYFSYFLFLNCDQHTYCRGHFTVENHLVSALCVKLCNGHCFYLNNLKPSFVCLYTDANTSKIS